MRPLLIALTLFLPLSFAQAKEYGKYDPKRMLTVTESPSGKRHGLDGRYLDLMMGDLALHAKNYPPQFDTPQDQERASRDAKMLSGMLDILVDAPNPNPEILWRAGFLNSIGHNLDIPGSGEKASAIFQRLLAAEPGHPRGNYLYGTFLASAGKPKDALPYLEKALAAGVTNAGYTLGMTYLSLGDKARALEHLEAHRQRFPNDGNVARLIDAVRNGKVETRKNSN